MSITTIRPNGQLAFAGISGTGGASNAICSDNSDATYIFGTTDDGYVQMTYGSISLSAGQRVKSCTLKIRNAAQSVSPGRAEPMLARIGTQSGLGGTPVGGFTTTRSTATVATQSGPISYTAPGGRAWSQAEVNALITWMQWFTATDGTATFQRVHETYIDVDVNNIPTITGAPTVTGFTNNSKPTVTWVYADSDGDPQAVFRVRIFTSNVVLAGNFNADTSPSVWDSGNRFGVDSSITCTQALQNGTAYYSYVNVAHHWQGPQGQYWWSGWAASASFTVTFTTPYTPVINSAAVLTGSNQYRTALSVSVPINLLTMDNSSFETTVGNWANITNCAVVRDTAQHADGLAALKMTSSASGDMVAGADPDSSGQPAVSGGQAYTFIANFKSAVSARSCAVGVQWVDIAGANIGAVVYGSNVTDSTANFNTQATLVSTVAPTNAVKAKVRAKVIATGAASEVHWVDTVAVSAGSSTTWNPGGYINDQGDLIVERGEYLDDARGPAENWFHPQVASAGTLVKSAGYGFSWDTTQTQLTWEWLNKAITAAGDTPAGMLNWRLLAASASVLYFGVYLYGGTAYLAPVLPSQSHTFSVWAWCDTTTVGVRARIDWRDSAGSSISTTDSATVTLTTTPQRITITGTAPSNAYLAAGAAININSDTAHHMYFTRAGFGPGTTPVDGRKPYGLPSGVLPTGVPAGLVWKPVRWNYAGLTTDTNTSGGAGAPGYSTGQVTAVSDWEYPPGRPALYRASIVYTSADGVTAVASPYSSQVTVYAAPPALTFLRSTTNPLLQAAVNPRPQVSHSWTDDAAVFHPLGADAAPIRIRDWVGGEDGQLVIVTSSEPQFARVRDLITTNDVLCMQHRQGGRTYLIVTGRAYDEVLNLDQTFVDADGATSIIRYAVITLDYLECASP